MSSTADAAQRLKALTERKHNQLIRLHFPKGDGPEATLVANRMETQENLSRDFHVTVELLSSDPHIELKTVLGKMVSIELTREQGEPRFFNGYVFEFRFVRIEGGLGVYDMVLLPWLAFLRLRKDNHLFHSATVEDQTSEIFADYNAADWRMQALGDDPVMTDACQFDESDYNYLHRRWEALGWHYWYEHRQDGHTLVISGDSRLAEPIAGASPEVPWHDQARLAEDHGIVQFTPVRRLSSNLVAASSFDFKKPRPALSSATSLNEQGSTPDLEVYEYTGAYGFATRDAGEAWARLRMEEIDAAAKHFEAIGNHRGLWPGRWFTLTGHFDERLVGVSNAERDFLLIDVAHSATNNYEAGQAAVAEYHNRFTCLRKSVPWRPSRGLNSTEPKIYGLQTALVTGPAGSEIHSDEYGRVKVQFHWDRHGQFDEKSSAWVRVASTWAGANFGFIAIPRIGQEVLVQFLDGNPDRPLITGRVYNAANKPPWDLPANQTQTGILTRSSQGGSYGNANALRFEDKKGEEQLWIHAEKNQDIEVENDETHWVGHDRRKTIDHDETVHVKHDRTETVDNNETITVGVNRSEQVGNNETIAIGVNRTETVGANETITIGANRSISVGASETATVALQRTHAVGINESIAIGAAQEIAIGAAQTVTIGAMQSISVGATQSNSIGSNRSVSVGGAQSTQVAKARSTSIGEDDKLSVGKNLVVTAADSITFTTGSASITMKKDGTITIKGKDITIDGSGKINAKASGNIVMKGSKILQN